MMHHLRVSFVLSCIMLLAAPVANARLNKASVQALIDSFQRAIPAAKGIIVHVEAPRAKTSFSIATGVSDTSTRRALSADQPVLIASNTKTYVAAAVLKLQERHQLDIEQPVAELLPDSTLRFMQADGYDVRAIRVKHLLSHSSGIDDYVNDAYFQTVKENKRRRWSRAEQIKLAFTTGKPLGAPGDTFRYADINYLLLTEIIEGKTGEPCPQAIRELLDYRSNKLMQTWFTTLEPAPGTIPAAPHQYAGALQLDSYDLDPSWDLYGGGGIMATAKDLALFFQALFDRKIIRDSAVLNLMHVPVMPDDEHHYALGIRVLNIDGYPAYYHGGFWGTDAAFFPDLDASIAIVILEKDQRGISGIICRRIAAALRDDASH